MKPIRLSAQLYRKGSSISTLPVYIKIMKKLEGSVACPCDPAWQMSSRPAVLTAVPAYDSKSLNV